MRSSDGQFQWTALIGTQLCADPDPARRPQLQSGQPELDRLLSLQTLGSALTRSLDAGLRRTAQCLRRRWANTGLRCGADGKLRRQRKKVQPLTPQYCPQTLADNLPTLLQQGTHTAPAPGLVVTYQFMSDDYAQANAPDNFRTFSLTLRMLHTVFGAFERTPQATSLIAALNKHSVYVAGSAEPMGAFYQEAATKLIDYIPSNGGTPPSLIMPSAWDGFSSADEAEIIANLTALLLLRSSQVLAPMGRFQDASRLSSCRSFCGSTAKRPVAPRNWYGASPPIRSASPRGTRARAAPRLRCRCPIRSTPTSAKAPSRTVSSQCPALPDERHARHDPVWSLIRVAAAQFGWADTGLDLRGSASR